MHRYSSLLIWSVPLGQRGHVEMVLCVLCTKCTLHSNHRLTLWYYNTQNFPPVAAIFSLHTPASHSAQKYILRWKTTYWENLFLSYTFYLNRFRKYVPYGFPTINFCNPGVHFETPCIITRSVLFWNDLFWRSVMKRSLITWIVNRFWKDTRYSHPQSEIIDAP